MNHHVFHSSQVDLTIQMVVSAVLQVNAIHNHALQVLANLCAMLMDSLQLITMIPANAH